MKRRVNIIGGSKNSLENYPLRRAITLPSAMAVEHFEHLLSVANQDSHTLSSREWRQMEKNRKARGREAVQSKDGSLL